MTKRQQVDLSETHALQTDQGEEISVDSNGDFHIGCQTFSNQTYLDLMILSHKTNDFYESHKHMGDLDIFPDGSVCFLGHSLSYDQLVAMQFLLPKERQYAL